MGDRHLESIQQQVGTLLLTSTGLSLIDWTADLKDEKQYNREAAKNGYICPDRALIKTDLHPTASKPVTYSVRATTLFM